MRQTITLSDITSAHDDWRNAVLDAARKGLSIYAKAAGEYLLCSDRGASVNVAGRSGVFYRQRHFIAPG